MSEKLQTDPKKALKVNSKMAAFDCENLLKHIHKTISCNNPMKIPSKVKASEMYQIYNNCY